MSRYQERNYAPKGRIYLDNVLKNVHNATKNEVLCKINVESVPLLLNKEENIVVDYVITSQPEENIIKDMKILKKTNTKKVKEDSASIREREIAKYVMKFLFRKVLTHYIVHRSV